MCRETPSIILEAVCALLRQHHADRGLCVWPWFRPPGNVYFSFYLSGVRDEQGRPRYLPDLTGTYCLTIYQGHVGIPAWAAGEQLSLEPAGGSLTSDTVLDWYHEHLTLSRFFADHADATSQWRLAYGREDAARYLLTWEIMAGVGGMLQEPLLAYGGDTGGYGISKLEHEIQERLATPHPEEQVILLDRMAFAVDGRAWLPSGEVVDLWQRHLDGDDASAVALELATAATQPACPEPDEIANVVTPSRSGSVARLWYGRTVIGPKDTFGGVLVWAEDDEERAYAVAWLDGVPEDIRRNVAHVLDSLWLSDRTILHEALSTLAGSGMVGVEQPQRRVETDDLQAVADAELLALGPDGKGSG